MPPGRNPGWWLVVAGGGFGVLAAFLTWASVDYGVATHRYVGVGAGRDGKLTVVLAATTLVVAALTMSGVRRGWQRGLVAVLGLAIALVAVADLAASPSVGSQEQARLRTAITISSSNGIGEWLTLLAGLLIVVGVLLAGRYAPQPVAADGD